MVNQIKLEKGYYHLAGKTFTQALEELDPSASYLGTEWEGLDAYERQLKRFGIRVAGESPAASGADPVEKFFASSETAVLFPEFVRRSLALGMDDPVLKNMVAARTLTSAVDYRSVSLSDGSQPYDTVTAEGAVFPETTLKAASGLVPLEKHGRTLSFSYEAVRQQRLDLFSVLLKTAGGRLARAVTAQAVSVLLAGAEEIPSASSALSYEDLVGVWGRFESGNPSVLLASPDMMASILTLEQMRYSYQQYMADGTLATPFGALLMKSSAVPAGKLIALDASCALEMVQSGELVLDSDRLADRQMDRTTISVTTGFSKIVPEAVQVLSLKTA